MASKNYHSGTGIEVKVSVSISKMIERYPAVHISVVDSPVHLDFAVISFTELVLGVFMKVWLTVLMVIPYS